MKIAFYWTLWSVGISYYQGYPYHIYNRNIPVKHKFRSTNTANSFMTFMTITLEDIQAAYDGIKLDEYYNQRPLEVIDRLVEIGTPILGWWIAKTADNITAPFLTAEENQQRVNLRAEQLKNAIVEGKSVTFIKSGQALALRPDIIKSPEYVRELQKLQDEVGTFPNRIAMKIIAEEMGKDPAEIYDFNPPTPIASASIGQVYRAKLKSNNQWVAVKVQRPDALEKAAIDMYILRKIAAFVKKQKKLRSDLVGIADEFGKQLYNELNYRQEARNCQKFKDLYGSIPGIYVPSPYFNFTTQRVLTMEFVDGVKGPWPTGGERMLTVGLQCSVLQLLGTGYFHSDPHRGNLLQTRNGELAYLDFGMMAEVPGMKRFALIGTVLGLVNKDINMVISSMKELDFLPPDTDTDLVVTALNIALQNSTDGGEGSSLNFTKLNQNLESISNLLPFRLPPFYTMIIRSLTILEGLALYVDPNFKLVRGAYPFIAKQILTDPSPDMNKLLQAILINEQGRIRWDKLEKFISISSKVDEAIGGDFKALKAAQSKSDLLKVYKADIKEMKRRGIMKDEDLSEESKAEEEGLTFDVVAKIMDYVLSENGRFLRDALVNEIVDTIDSLGLTSQAVASLITNRLIPQPSERPDRERVVRFFRLLDIVSGQLEPKEEREQRRVRAMMSADLTGDSSSGFDADETFLGDVSAVSNRAIWIGRWVLSILLNPPVDRMNTIQPILTKSSVILNSVAIKLIEKNTVRVVRGVFNPKNIQSVIPVVSRLVSLLPKV